MTQVPPTLSGSAVPPASCSAAAPYLITQSCLPDMSCIPSQDSITTTNQLLPSLVEAYQVQCHMLLRPFTSSQTLNGKPLLIPDHVSRLAPFKEEKILSTESNTKLSLAVGNKKPKF